MAPERRSTEAGSTVRTRLVLPGQYGPLFDDGGPVLVVEAREFFDARPMHRAKAHLWLSALRHRVRELGDRAEHVQVDRLKDALVGRDDLEVVDPPSRTLRAQVRHWGKGTEILPSRGFITDEAEFAEWAAQGTGRFRMETHYERVRRREGWLMRSEKPIGGKFSLDDQNREPPPKGAATLGLPEPWWPTEDEIDDEVRRDLDRWERDGAVRFVGRDDTRRFAVTADEARQALDDFVQVRLSDFGPYEDATLTNDWTMAHSLLSVPMNLGVLDPFEVVEAALAAHRDHDAPLASVEGFVRQVAGWRDYVWHLYWWFGDDYGAEENALDAHEHLPRWWRELDASEIDAVCLSTAIEGLHDHGWLHHIQRLMVLGNWALQRGYDPVHLTEWFTTSSSTAPTGSCRRTSSGCRSTPTAAWSRRSPTRRAAATSTGCRTTAVAAATTRRNGSARTPAPSPRGTGRSCRGRNPPSATTTGWRVRSSRCGSWRTSTRWWPRRRGAPPREGRHRDVTTHRTGGA